MPDANGNLTVQEAADSLGISYDGVINAIREKRMQATKNAWARRWLIRPDEVERYRQTHLGRRGRQAEQE